jgi:hypothetical protein
MIDDCQILPVLDGLDEMDDPGDQPHRARRVLDQLNEDTCREWPLVLICRTETYRRIRNLTGGGSDGGLHHAEHIELKPFTNKQAAAYLGKKRKEIGATAADWAPVIKLLNRDSTGTLSTALRTPWLLSLSAVALQEGGADAARELATCDNQDEVQNLLFRSLIPAAVKSGSDNKWARGYTEDKVHIWLRTLAVRLEHNRSQGLGGAQIPLDKLWRLAGTTQVRVIHSLSLVLVVALATAAAIHYKVVWSSGSSPEIRLWYLIIATIPFVGIPLAIGLGVRSATRSDGTTSRFAWRVPAHRRWPRSLKAGAFTSVLVALFGTVWAYTMFAGWSLAAEFSRFFVFIRFYWLYLLGVGVDFGLAVGVVVALIVAFDTTSAERLALGKGGQHVIRDDWVAGLIFGLAGALALQTPGYISPQPHDSDTGPDSYGLRANIMGAIFIALIVMLLVARVSGRHLIASVMFKMSGDFPLRSARFLDWGRQTGVLRMTGIAYQFRHDTFQKWILLH